jgi:hypothetical protein
MASVGHQIGKIVSRFSDGDRTMFQFTPLLAEANAWAVAIILFCVILGLLVTLNPSKRTFEIKRTKDEN